MNAQNLLAEAPSNHHSRSTPRGEVVTNEWSPDPRTWSDLDEYLKAAHLPAGKTVPATKNRIEFRTLHPRPGMEEIKPVMFFVGGQKGLILTSTNQDFLRLTFSDEISASHSKSITLRAVRKTIADRGVDTILIGLPDTTTA